MKLADTLICTKINLPFTRPGLVARQQLREKMMQGLLGPLTLVTGAKRFIVYRQSQLNAIIRRGYFKRVF